MRGHLVGLQPDAHGERAVAENVGALHAADGAQLRLDDARQVVGDLRLIEIRRREAEIHRGELRVGGLELNHRRFGFGRQIVSDLRDLRLNLRERIVGVVIQLQVHRDRADGLAAGRLHVVDSVGAGDDALERRGDEAAHQIGVRADVGRRHLHDRDVAARVLPYAERADRLQPGNQNHQVDDDGEYGPLDEEIGELHQLFSGFGAALLPGFTALLICTAAPLRSLKRPDVTTSSRAVTPEMTAT